MLAGAGAFLGAGLVGGRAWAASEGIRSDFQLTGQFTQGGWARCRLPGGAINASFNGRVVSMAKQGDTDFFIAFDRDAGPAAVLAAHYVDAPDLHHPLPIAPRHWQIESINAPFHPAGVADAEFARIRAAELARIGAARAHSTDAQGWRQNFLWPAKGRVSGLFGAQRIYRGADGKPVAGAYHPGLDIALPTGTPFGAPADGVVILAADHPFTLEGNLLMIDHGMGLNSAFLHCSKLLVREGDRVAQGQPLGLVGMTGRATGPHLHWALKWRDSRLDPMLFAGQMR